MKLLILSTIQSDNAWQNDCQVIARDVIKHLNYELPNSIYEDYFIEFLIPLIADKSILAYSSDDIESMLYEVTKNATNDSYSSLKQDCVYHFDSSIKEVVNIHNAIDHCIGHYYNTSKIKLTLDSLHENTVLIYPKNYYRHLLMKAFPNTKPKFNCTTNKPKKMLQEFEIMTGFKDYQVIKI
jgi:hypothetical protein